MIKSKINLFNLGIFFVFCFNCNVVAMKHDTDDSSGKGQESEAAKINRLEKIIERLAGQTSLRQRGGATLLGSGAQIDPMGEFKTEVMTQIWDTAKGSDIYKRAGMAGVASACGGILGSIDKIVGVKSQSLLKSVFDSVGRGLGKVKDVLFHGFNSSQLTSADVLRWKNKVENMLMNLEKIAESSGMKGKISQSTAMLVRGTDDANSKEHEDSEGLTIDKSWQEIANMLILKRILFLALEINCRRQYYKKSDEIIVCFDSLLGALIGDGNIESLVKALKVENYSVDELIQEGLNLGGIYETVRNAKSLSDLSSTQTKTWLKLFHELIKGIFAEMEAWVRVKIGESSRNGMRSSMSSYGSGNSVGNYGYGGGF